MSKNTILVPKKEFLEGKEFESLEAKGTEKALRNCQEEGYQALFMPVLIDTKIEALKDSRVWQVWYSTPSIKATGKTRQGNAVVVYAHIPNYFSDPNNIKKAVEQGLVNHAGIMPQDEFQKLLDLEDNKNVFVVDYNLLNHSLSDAIVVDEALKHPQTIPFLGGEERAEKYLQRHKEVYGNNIGLWHSDDLSEQPLGRLLFVGFNYYDGLSGDVILDNLGRFLGVKPGAGAAQKDIIPTPEKLEKIIGEFVAPLNHPELKERIANLYK